MATKIFVWSWRSHNLDHDWKDWCKKHGKYWCFQLEKGEQTDREHYQGIISLKVKRDKRTCLSLMQPLPEYFEPVCNSSIKGGSQEFYVTKEETRVDGPWSDKDVVIFIPRQYEGIMEKLYPFQKTIWDSVPNRDYRTINVVIDLKGENGKSSIGELMEIHGRGYNIPTLNCFKEISQMVCNVLIDTDNRDPGCFIFDIPRGLKQDDLRSMYAGIEQIKNGKVFDTRYHYKAYRFHSPAIWVFTNTIPLLSLLSKDRWRLWEITKEDHAFKPFTGMDIESAEG